MIRTALTFGRDLTAAISEGLGLALDMCYPMQGVERAAAQCSAGVPDDGELHTHEGFCSIWDDSDTERPCCCDEGPEFICTPCADEDHDHCARPPAGDEDYDDDPMHEAASHRAEMDGQPELHCDETVPHIHVNPPRYSIDELFKFRARIDGDRFGEPPLTGSELVGLRQLLEERFGSMITDQSSTASAGTDDSPGEVSDPPLSPSPGLPTSATDFAGAMYPMHTKHQQ